MALKPLTARDQFGYPLVAVTNQDDIREHVTISGIPTVDLANPVAISGTSPVQLDGPVTTTISGTPTVAVSGTVLSAVPAYHEVYQKWENTPITVGHNSFVDVYVVTSSPVTLLSSIWQLNTDKMYLRILIDGVVVADLDLYELQKDFKLQTGFVLELYALKRWRFQPLIPITANNEIKIQMKSHSGNKGVLRGISVLRVVT